MIDHKTPFDSKFFGLGAALCVVLLVGVGNWNDYNRAPNAVTDPNAIRNERLTRSLNLQATEQARAEAAQLYCGNAG